MAPARRRRAARFAAWAPAFAAAALMAGCAAVPDTSPTDRASGNLPVQASPPAPRSAPDGETLRTFYALSEQQLQDSGRMRREVAPADAPFTDEDLVRNFVRIALYEEYTDVNGRFVHSEKPAPLRRWEKPVRVAVMTGPSESVEEAARDRSNVAAFVNRLAWLTGHDVAMAKDKTEANLLVLFMTDAERLVFAQELPKLYPGFAPAVLTAMRSVQDFCITYSFWEKSMPSAYSAVIIQIPLEQPQFTKLSCVQEEMAQAMGLPNDSFEARPSLFNDEKEFALLTEHDAMLLRMLYDPRLTTGMSASEALPLLPAIAADARAAEKRDSGAAVAAN